MNRSSARSSTAFGLLRVAVPVLLLWPVGAPIAAASSTDRPKQRPTATEQQIRDLQAKRNQVRVEKARRAAKVDALKATDAQIRAALADLTDHVAATTAQLEDAERAAAQAEAEQAEAEAAEAQAQADLLSLRDRLRQQAIDAYVTSPADAAWSVLSATDAQDATARRTFLQLRSDRSLDSVEDFRSLQEDLAAQRQRATNAAARARKHRAAVDANLEALQAAQAEQQRFAAQVDARIDAELAEAESLAALDASLSSQIVQRQAALAREVAARRAAEEAARRAMSRSGRSTRSGAIAAPAAATPSVAPRSFATSGGAGIVNVQGIRVAASIAGNLDALLNAARAAGFNLSGGGYRDPAAQIAVRRNNCGSSNYAIYEAPASSCRPPTARPGQSMHEQGLAIDFAEGGRVLSRGSPAYAWLKANAAQYGFFNLPSEPWHWSVNGN